MFLRVLRLRRFAYALRAVRRLIPRRVPLRRLTRVFRRRERGLRRLARVFRRRERVLRRATRVFRRRERGLRRFVRRRFVRICRAFLRVRRPLVRRLRFVRI